MDHFDIINKGKLEMLYQAYFTTEVPNSGSCNIDWTKGNKQKITLPAGVNTVTFTNPQGATTLTLRVIQGTGVLGTINWSGSTIKWSNGGTLPTFTTGAGKVDIVGLYFDGATYWGIFSNNFA